MCRSFLGRRSCVLFLSSCSARGRLLLTLLLVLLLCLFLRRLQFYAACPAAGYPEGVTQPFWFQLPVLLLRWSYVCWVCGVFGALPPGPVVCAAYPAAGCPWGVSAFSDTVCLTYCCASGVGWAATLPLCYQCFSCTGWLAGVRWVLHSVSGSSHRCCDFFGRQCSSAFWLYLPLGLCWLFCRLLLRFSTSVGAVLCSLLVFPCLRVGVLLA